MLICPLKVDEPSVRRVDMSLFMSVENVSSPRSCTSCLGYAFVHSRCFVNLGVMEADRPHISIGLWVSAGLLAIAVADVVVMCLRCLLCLYGLDVVGVVLHLGRRGVVLRLKLKVVCCFLYVCVLSV